MYARDRSGGRESVQDIGDFIAHPQEKTTGLIVRTVRNLTFIIRSKLAINGVTIDVTKIPENLPDLIRINSKHLAQQLITRETGFSRVKVQKILPAILSKLLPNPDGSFRMEGFTNDEFSVMNCILTFFSIFPAFNASKLFDDFSETLLDLELLQRKKELSQFKAVKNLITVFALRTMHKTTVVLPHMSDALISVGLAESQDANDGERNYLSANVVASATWNGDPVRVSFSVFRTDLLAEKYCEVELLSRLNKNHRFDCDIDINAKGRLSELV